MSFKEEDKLYKILGISEHCSSEELKRAYKRKAKELHPDRNNSDHSHEEFIKLNEAYELLLRLKETEMNNSISVENKSLFNTWKHSNREKFRKKVKQEVKDKINTSGFSDKSSTRKAVETVICHFVFILSITNVLILPLILTYNYKLTGLALSAVINLFTILITASAIRNLHLLSGSQFLSSIKQLIQLKNRHSA